MFFSFYSQIILSLEFFIPSNLQLGIYIFLYESRTGLLLIFYFLNNEYYFKLNE